MIWEKICPLHTSSRQAHQPGYLLAFPSLPLDPTNINA